MTYAVQPSNLKISPIQKNSDGQLEVDIDVSELGSISSFSIEATSESGIQGSSSDFSIEVIPTCLDDIIYLN